MPSINNRNRANTRTTSTTGANATAATNAANNANNAANNAAAPEIRSASGQIIQPRPVTQFGLNGQNMNATGTTNRFARDSSFDTYNAAGEGAVARGFIRPDATAIPGGMRINVKSFHKTAHSKVTLYLMAEVLDQKTNQLRTITLSVLTNNEDLCGSGFRGDHYFDVKFADLNKFLQSKNPNLKIVPGHTTLAVAARWSNGHQAGGFGRGGTFRVPIDSSTQSVVSVRASRANNDEADLPLDMQVAYPQKLLQAVPQLKPDGNIVSRLESEFKGEASKSEMTSAITKMYEYAAKAQAGDTRDLQRVVGKDWTVSTVNRYWLKDDGSTTEGKPGTGFFKGFRVDDDGLPLQDPMRDQYMDDANMRMTRHEGAIRLRTNNQATVINVKPGGGREDTKTGIRQRVEVGLELKPNSTVAQAGDTLKRLSTNNQWSGTTFNHAQKQVHELDPELHLQNALQPWLEVVQDRHKFTLTNEKTGVEIEFSFDKVRCKTLRPNLAESDGTPREVEFYVLEGELDHLQLASTNASAYAASPTTTSAFTNDSQQDAWLTATSPDVTMDIEPRLHELGDLNNQSFRSTLSYKQFEQANGAIIPHLFPNGLQYGRQKAAAAAEKLGLVHFDDASLRASVKKQITSAGFEWSPELKKAVEDAVADPGKRANLDIALVNGTAKNVASFVQTLGVNASTLKYDLGKVKGRIKDRLHELGYQSSSAIESMFDKMTTTNITPQNFESYLTRMASVQDPQVLQQFARALGVNPAPTVVADPARLLSGTFGQTLEANLKTASVDPGSFDAVKDFLLEAQKGGLTIHSMRQEIANLRSNPENRLTQIASRHNATAPKLRADVKNLVSLANQQMQAQYFSVGPEMKKFLSKIADDSTVQESINFVNSLRSNAETHIENKARVMGVSAPKLKYDFDAIERYLQPQLDNQSIKLNPEMKKFIRSAIEDAGVPPSQLTRVFQQIGNHGTLKGAMTAANVFIAGIQLPELEYDMKTLVNKTTQRFASWPNAFSPQSIERYIEGALKAGMTPGQLHNFSYYDARNGRAQANRYAPNATHAAIPRLPIDNNALIAHWKTRTPQMTPEQEKYIDDNLQKAFEHPSSVLNSMYNQGLARILSNIATWSGVPRPQGV